MKPLFPISSVLALALLLTSTVSTYAFPVSDTEDVHPDWINVESGDPSSGAVSELSQSDDVDLSIRRSSSTIQPVVEISVGSTSPFSNLSALEFVVESSVFSRGGVTQTISLFNFNSGQYEQVGSQAASRFSDSLFAVQVDGDTSRFVEEGTFAVLAKIRYQATSPRAQFSANLDHVFWRLTNQPQIIPLFDENSVLEPETTIDTPEALITRIGDRVRDRHAREGQFQAYDHYLSFYWEQRTVEIEIVDRVAKGGSAITINTKSLTPLSVREFRCFFRGLSTVAEYHHNVNMTPTGTNEYTTTISWNTKAGRAIQVGDRMEFEFSPFLASPNNGRTNYYGTAILYVVGEGVVPWQGEGQILDSFPIPPAGLLGGMTTLHYQYSNEPEHLFKQLAGNTAPASAQPFMLGRRLHHTDFGNGAHSEQPNPTFLQQIGKLGPLYINRSCVDCHVNNGRSLPPAVGQPLLQAVVRVADDKDGTPHSQYGSVLQPDATSGTSEPSVSISGYEIVNGTYGDGTEYTLRKPLYQFSGTSSPPKFFSVRLAQPLVGIGLLEAVPESVIESLADPDDADGDGISGRVQTVYDPETGDLRLGRLNHKAGKARISHQIASALNTDMGVATNIFPVLDGNSSASAIEVDDAALSQMTRYVAALGVNPRRDLTDAEALLGEQLFNSHGCASCHTPALTTSNYAPMTELRNQTIHPYTDLLLHDLGPGLADNMGEDEAAGSEWRTSPLWNIGHTEDVVGGEAYLHDGRARNLAEAILWHEGEANAAKESFRASSVSERDALIKFLKSL